MVLIEPTRGASHEPHQGACSEADLDKRARRCGCRPATPASCCRTDRGASGIPLGSHACVHGGQLDPKRKRFERLVKKPKLLVTEDETQDCLDRRSRRERVESGSDRGADQHAFSNPEATPEVLSCGDGSWSRDLDFEELRPVHRLGIPVDRLDLNRMAAEEEVAAIACARHHPGAIEDELVLQPEKRRPGCPLIADRVSCLPRGLFASVSGNPSRFAPGRLEGLRGGKPRGSASVQPTDWTERLFAYRGTAPRAIA